MPVEGYSFAGARCALVSRPLRRREAFSDDDRAFIESRPFMFLATADTQAAPDCSYKGLLPGHLRVTGPATFSFPSKWSSS